MSRRTAAALTTRAASFIYGTAGKGDNTVPLIRAAIAAGFRAIDTAAQPSRYAEDLTGEGIRSALKDGSLRREDLWIQTKFTPVHDQDEGSSPYNISASVDEQVKRSIEQSLDHLAIDGRPYIDSVLLHSPYKDASATMEAWQAICRHSTARVGALGVSNMTMEQLDELMQAADMKPTIVQNRFTAETGYDLRLRAYCRDKGIAYQTYGVLTNNDHLLNSSTVQELARDNGTSPESTLCALIVVGLNTSVLNGTSNRSHMQDDLAAVNKLRAWRENNRNRWMNMLSSFKGSLSRGRVL